MLDPQRLRRDVLGIAQALSARGYVLDVEVFSQLESDRKLLQAKQQSMQNQRNKTSKNIG